jgi:hypothetical protein
MKGRDFAMQDRRRTTRLRTYLGAQIDDHARSSVVNCVVRNLTNAGAKLIILGAAPTGQEFFLSIPKQKRVVPARLIWRTAKEAGVAFDQSQSAPVPLDLVRRLRQREAEKAARRVARQPRGES